MTRRLRLVAGETFDSLHNRNFRLFFAGQGISQVGNWLTMAAQALFVYGITSNGFLLGLLVAFQFGPVLLIGPWAGLVADRADKRRLLLLVQSVAMLQSFGLAALVFSGSRNVVLVYALAAIGGLTTAFDNPARRSFVTEMVAEDQIANAVSLNSSLMMAARVIGPALGGLMIATVGFAWCFLLDGVSYFAVLVCLLLMRAEELRPAKPAPRGKGQVREGLRYARHHEVLWVPLVMMGVIGLLTFNFMTLLPLLVTRDLGGTGTAFTVLMSVMSIGSVVGALVSARRQHTTVRTVAVAAVAFGAGMVTLMIVPSLTAAFVVAVPVGFASISFMTASTAIVQVESSPSMRGRVLALQSMLFLGSTPIGGPLVGAIAERFGARYAIGLGAVAALATGAWGLLRSGDPQMAGDAGIDTAADAGRRDLDAPIPGSADIDATVSPAA